MNTENVMKVMKVMNKKIEINEKPVTIKSPILIEEIPCPKCGVGTMEYGETTLKHFGPYYHECPNCHYGEFYKDMYPRYINGHTGKGVKLISFY